MKSIYEVIDLIPGRIDVLREADPNCREAGARRHNYGLLPTVSEETLVEFETKHEVRLPKDYRYFLKKVGNGCAGPNYGLIPLDTGDLPNPLPYSFGGGSSVPPLGKLNLPFLWTSPVYWACEDSPEYLLEMEGRGYTCVEIDEWDGEPGCLDISTAGCSHMDILIINGETKGTVWRTCTDYAIPTGASFLDWYLYWLNDSLKEAGRLDLGLFIDEEYKES